MKDEEVPQREDAEESGLKEAGVRKPRQRTWEEGRGQKAKRQKTQLDTKPQQASP